MGRIWEFFENMDELVYVSDMDSHELVYMNKKALKTFGFRSQESLAGKMCYEVIQNCPMPCVFCSNHELRPGYFRESQYYNLVLDKYLMLKTTKVEEEGKRYRMEIALDISSQDQRENTEYNRGSLEAIINEGLRVALQEKTPSQSLEVLLGYLGKALGGERTYIFEKNEKGGDDNTYEWTARGVTSEKDNLQDLPPELCENWYQNFGVGKHIVIKNLEDIRETDPLQYENLNRQKIRSLVVVPLYDDGEIIGFYGVDNPSGNSLNYASNMLQIAAHFIVSSLKRRNLVRKLEEMSYYDQLTKIGNRHAMNGYIDKIQQGQSIGIVYCDVTGLKRVNDEEGHKAGDRLILKACESLKQTFGGYGLFRIGGDELLVICLQIEEEALLEKVEALKKNLLENLVHMSVGASWEKDGSSGVDRLMAEAEKRMYKDKSEYYQRRGINRRR